MTTAMLAEAVTGASAGPASLIVLALVLLVAFGRVLRRLAKLARQLLGSVAALLSLLAAVSGIGVLLTATMVMAAASR
ncbi:hypothetical protein [Amycolatopsis saalfeldensis]|uniref:Uncharacterized protein n=1 Tax=Amycolatopsis saalfeldensis TaxID=394193 RepID=A0A1H8XVL6_9PSEU|nr:hypothetical protein [Amycolatopsis saalfeldensis]SEP43802.1 hypothetical protein SAMN04489732_109107 [Amycolatopsis saalfeldensis]